MKLAGVQCRITSWGALEVFKDLIKEEITASKFSAIQIFTSYSEFKELEINWKKINITTALPKRLNQFFIRNSKKKLPILWRLFDYRNLMFFYPLIMKIISYKIKQYTPNKILISSFAIAKNIEQCKVDSKPNKQNITLYLHSPMQYIRSHYDEYIGKLTWFKKRLFKNITPHLRKRDHKYTKYDKAYANSEYTKQLAKKIYNLDLKGKYPLLEKERCTETIIIEPKDYYIYVGRLVNFVRETNTIITLFNILKSPLVVMGSWPDEQELKKIANGNIVFIWRINDIQERIKIIGQSRWLINITKESFGLGTAESLCLWVPVFGYNDGATPELVDKDSWTLVENKTISQLKNKFKEFENTHRKRENIAAKARKKFTAKI